MLKYLYCKECFQEVPNEISLGISISGCTLKCYGCHSKELWEDRGIPLTTIELDKLIKDHMGVTCVCFFGGEHDIDILKTLCARVHYVYKLKTAWYCGLDDVPVNKRDILEHLDYYKTGHYDKNLGGLDCKTTNQHLYQIEHLGNGDYWETDITYKFQNKN